MLAGHISHLFHPFHNIGLFDGEYVSTETRSKLPLNYVYKRFVLQCHLCYGPADSAASNLRELTQVYIYESGRDEGGTGLTINCFQKENTTPRLPGDCTWGHKKPVNLLILNDPVPPSSFFLFKQVCSRDPFYYFLYNCVCGAAGSRVGTCELYHIQQ